MDLKKLAPARQKLFIDHALEDDFQYIITKVTDGDLQMLNVNESGTYTDKETGEIVEV